MSSSSRATCWSPRSARSFLGSKILGCYYRQYTSVLNLATWRIDLYRVEFWGGNNSWPTPMKSSNGKPSTYGRKSSLTAYVSRTMFPIVVSRATTNYKCQGETLLFGKVDLAIPPSYQRMLDSSNISVLFSRFKSFETMGVRREFEP